MRNQKIILTGIVIWLAGCFMDVKLIRYAYAVIILGTIVASFGAIMWLRSKDNRARLKKTMTPKRGFGEMIKQAFDFRWQRVSIIWTICAFVGMLIVHLGAVMLKSMGAYDCAIQAIKKDRQIIEQVGEVIDFTYMVSENSTTGNGYSELYFGVLGTTSSVNVKAVIEGHSGSYIPYRIIIQE